MSLAQLMRRASHRAASCSSSTLRVVRGTTAGGSTSLQIAHLRSFERMSLVSRAPCPTLLHSAPRSPSQHPQCAPQPCRITTTSQEICKQLGIKDKLEEETVKVPQPCQLLA